MVKILLVCLLLFSCANTKLSQENKVLKQKNEALEELHKIEQEKNAILMALLKRDFYGSLFEVGYDSLVLKLVEDVKDRR